MALQQAVIALQDPIAQCFHRDLWPNLAKGIPSNRPKVAFAFLLVSRSLDNTPVMTMICCQERNGFRCNAK